MMGEVDSYQHAAAQAEAVTTATYGEARSFDTEAEMVQSITGAAPTSLTLDQLADDTLNHVAAFIGECVGGDTFAGFSVDEVRDEHGLLLSLRLVPCDLLHGSPVRRVERDS